jgi:hypothetical protein
MADSNTSNAAENSASSRVPRPRSVVWDRFSKRNDDKEVQCHICRENLVYKGTTSNMLEHLRRKHPYALKPDDQATKDSSDRYCIVLFINFVSFIP